MELTRNPHFHGETYPSRGHARRTPPRACWRMPGSPCPLSTAPSSPGEGGHPLLEQVPAGLLRQFGDLLRRLRPGHSFRRPGRRHLTEAMMRSKGHRPADLGGDLHCLHGLQHARPGGRRGYGVGPPAAPGHLHRRGLRGVHLHLRQWSRPDRPGAPAAGYLRLPGGRGGDQSLCLSLADGPAGARGPWRRRASCWPRPAIPRGGTRPPACP